ncbi:MAG: tetratricopeptide repeat protein [Thermoplasmata archaeon]|nr:tetratricopeptide repeat protein [Thermoplasmata archaeon]
MKEFRGAGMLDTGKRAGIDLVGRRKEISQIKDILKDVSLGRGKLVVVSGEAGVGKTRFLEEIKTVASMETFTLLSGKCLYFKDTDTCLPFKEMFNQYRKLKGSFCEDGKIDSPFIERGYDDGSGLDCGYDSDLVPMSLIPAEIEAEEVQTEEMEEPPLRMDMLSEFIFGLASEMPLCLFIDDLHWADSNTLQLLEYLCRRIKDDPILIICTYRPEDLFWGEGKAHPLTDSLKRLDKDAKYVRVRLNRFIELECEEFLKKILNVEAVPRDLVGIIYRLTVGNPFFMEELIHSMLEKGILTTEGPDILNITDPDAVTLPTNVKDVVLRRTHWLKPLSIKVIRVLSVVGLTFTFDVIKDALELDDEDVLEAIEELIQASFIMEGSEEELYKFENPLIREVIYSELNHSRRKYLHNRVARVLEDLYSNDPERWGDIALNYYLAKDRSNALVYLTKAVSHYKDSSPSRVISLLKLMIDCKEAMPRSDILRAENMEVFMEISNICLHMGDWKRAMEFSDEARALSVELGRHDVEVGSLLTQGRLNYLQGRFTEAAGLLNYALNLSVEHNDMEGKSRASMGLGCINWRQGDYHGALERYTSSLKFAKEQNDLNTLGTLYIHIGNLFNHKGDLDRSLEYYKRAIRHLNSTGDRLEGSRAYRNLGNTLIQTGDLANAHDMLRLSLDLAGEYGHENLWALINLIPIRCVREGQGSALTTYDTVMERLSGKGDRIGAALADMYMGVCRSRNGEDQEGGVMLKRSYDLLKEMKALYDVGRAAFHLGEHNLKFERKDVALKFLEESRDIFGEIGARSYLERTEQILSQFRDDNVIHHDSL